jgi:HEAT repeat protein
VSAYQHETQAMARMEIITLLSRMDDGETVTALLGLLSGESQPRVREQIIAVVGFMGSAPKELPALVRALTTNYLRGDFRERARTLDVLSNIPSQESAEFVSAIWRSGAAGAERGAARDAILKLSSHGLIEGKLTREAEAFGNQTQAPEE